MSQADVERPDLEDARRRVHVVLGGRERAALLRALDDGESVLHVARTHSGGHSGVVLLTDRRLITVVDTRFTHHVNSWPYEALTAVHWAHGEHHGTLHLFSGAHMDLVPGIEVHAARPLVEALRKRAAVQTMTEDDGDRPAP